MLSAYSVLTHEAVIDGAWNDGIKPLLLARYPHSSAADLESARAYAYAGCIIQDMGYYPFGSRLFSDLTHYVRSGDFILALLRESQNLNEYAFSLGALAHYAADTEGHRLAVNLSVPIDYPKLRRRYGPVVTYEDNKRAHMSVEFGFDVLQVARGNYATKNYHDFIGFEVATPVLERAFQDTYGIQMQDIFSNLDRALSWYRRTVSVIIPEMTRVAWSQRKRELQQAGLLRERFVYRLSRSEYQKEWSARYDQPGIFARFLGGMIEIFPKIGIFKTLWFKVPQPRTEVLFQLSFHETMRLYGNLLERQGSGQLQLEDLDFDTGRQTRPGEYRMCDDAYAQLAILLVEKNPAGTSVELRENVLAFFSDLHRPYGTERNPKLWQKTLAAVAALRAQESVTHPSEPKTGSLGTPAFDPSKPKAGSLGARASRVQQ
jgi:hypothetical protein